jgi:hypothetical protein
MRKRMEAALQRFGVTVQVVHGDTTIPVKAFFQPEKQGQTVLTPLGRVNKTRYLYVGPVEQPVDAGDSLIVDGIGYRVLHSDVFRDGLGPVYRFAMCRQKGGEDKWADQP